MAVTVFRAFSSSGARPWVVWLSLLRFPFRSVMAWEATPLYLSIVPRVPTRPFRPSRARSVWL